MKKKLLILWAFLITAFSFGQDILTNFQFNNNLSADGSYPGILTYHNSAGNIKTPAYDANMLKTTVEGEYLELSVDTSSKQSLVLSFYGDFAAWFLTGYWKVSVNTGTGGTFVNVGQQALYSVFNTPFGGNFSLNLPTAAENKSDLKIRIKSDFGFFAGTLRLDNLKLTSGSPKIKVYTSGDDPIPHLSPASTVLTTDFGVLENTATAVTRTFKVRNFQGTSGSKLKVSEIVITGANPGDFSVNATSLEDINSTNSDKDNTNQRSFNVSFKPLADGVRTAEIKLYSNSAPSPYIFTVLGTGASCKLVPGTNVINKIDVDQQSLASDFTTNDLISGKSAANSNSLNTRLYPGGENLYISSPSSWYTRNGSKTVNFGGTSGLDITKLKSVSIVFNVAAFSTSSTGGVNQNSSITLSVLKPDGITWSEEMKLTGSNNPGGYSYAFGSSKTFSGTVNGNLKEEINRNEGWFGWTEVRFGKIVLNIPASYGIQNLKFKITASSPDNDKLWLIDDVRIETQTAESRTWNGSSWVGGAPDINKKAFIDGDYLARPSFEACECEVNPGKSLVIDSGKVVKLRGNLINNGAFTMKSGGNLLQLEADAQNTGNITVERHVSAMNNISTKMDYVYWSSPVLGQQTKGAGGFSPGTPNNMFFTYRESNDRFYETGDPTFIPGKGYAVRAESGLPDGYSKDYKFTGVPNNGDYKIAITRSPDTGPTVHGYNLIGNPYPSNINFDQLFANNSSLINNTAWFWKNNSFTPNQQGQGYTGNNYMVYNGTGGNATGVTGIVKVGQGFLIQKKNLLSDSLIFKNSYGTNKDLRVTTNGTFYQRNNENKNRFWLKLISPNDVDNTQLIGYIDGATDAFEMDYDAEAFGLSSNLFYSLLEDKQLLIQGKANQFTNEDRISLGANFFQNSNYTIELEEREGIFANGQSIYLKDKLTGTITNLSQGSYTFEANKGETNARFEIIYKPETVLVTDSKVKDAVVVYRDSDYFVVKAPKIIATVEVYDLSGKMITVLKANSNLAILSAAFFTKGMYVLRIKTIDGEITSKKIVKQ
ncbi:MAG: T9SS type A sorting domain-containing protein [Flavobacteriales bacterium]|nr:T9SS type A sorting domain-containing protein [Flavobacteriales bacterium]